MSRAVEEYTYLCRMRPPAPGAVPRNGLKAVFPEEYEWNDRRYWGRVVYDRKLTEKELAEYELDLLGSEIWGKTKKTEL